MIFCTGILMPKRKGKPCLRSKKKRKCRFCLKKEKKRSEMNSTENRNGLFLKIKPQN